MLWLSESSLGGGRLVLALGRMPNFSEMPIKDLLAIWGAALSTILAGLKVYEYWRDRFRLEVDYDFSDSPVLGNTVTIRNLTSRPVIIKYRELLAKRRWDFFGKLEEVAFTSEEPYETIIAAHSSEQIRYCEMSHFSMNVGSLKGKSLYLKLWIAGRSPVEIRFFDPSS